jgi:hypothetical protein
MSLNIPKTKTIDAFVFELNDSCYECRGAMYHDDDHDQVPEPKLQEAANKLQGWLQSKGLKSEIEHGEKGWIEIYLTD